MDPQSPQIPKPASPAGGQPQPPRFPLLLVLLSLLSLLLLLSTGYLAYQNMQLQKQIKKLSSQQITTTPSTTPDPTANWKTYTNTSWDISFKYPAEWVDIIPSGESFISEGSANKVNLRIDKGRYYNNVPLDPYSTAFTVAVGQHPGGDNENTKIADIKVDGHDAVIISMDGLQSTQEAPSFLYDYIVRDGNSLFTLSFWSADGAKSKENITNQKQTFDQILSTFKFIDQPTTTPTTNYTCPAGGYVDCMPILDEAKQNACSQEAMTWYEANCPNFKGGAL